MTPPVIRLNPVFYHADAVSLLTSVVLQEVKPEDWQPRGGVASRTFSLRAGDSAFPTVAPLAFSVAERIVTPDQENIGKLVLSVIPPGVCLLAHDDTAEPDSSRTSRIHVPLVTNPGACLVFFQVKRSDTLDICHLAAGHIYLINQRRPHTAFNAGKEPRIHLVVDLIAKDAIPERKEW